MATYIELDTLAGDGDLLARVRTALRASAVAFIDAWIADPLTVTADQMVWARQVLVDPRPDAVRTLGAIVWDNRTFTVAQIQGATDAALKSRTAALVPWLVAARAVA